MGAFWLAVDVVTDLVETAVPLCYTRFLGAACRSSTFLLVEKLESILVNLVSCCQYRKIQLRQLGALNEQNTLALKLTQ